MATRGDAYRDERGQRGGAAGHQRYSAGPMAGARAAVQAARIAGRYYLEDRISESGQSTLWRAYDGVLGRPVTVRTFGPGFATAANVVAAARAACRVHDARLARVFDADVTAEGAYIVTEWPSGENLEDLLLLGLLEVGWVTRIVAEVASAIAAAHAAGIAHLRLTPRSVVWSSDAGVKIVGLGIDAALADAALADAAVADAAVADAAVADAAVADAAVADAAAAGAALADAPPADPAAADPAVAHPSVADASGTCAHLTDGAQITPARKQVAASADTEPIGMASTAPPRAAAGALEDPATSGVTPTARADTRDPARADGARPGAVTPETVRSDVVPTAQQATPDPGRAGAVTPETVVPTAEQATPDPGRAGAVTPETVVPTAEQATPDPGRAAAVTPETVVPTAEQATPDPGRAAAVTPETVVPTAEQATPDPGRAAAVTPETVVPTAEQATPDPGRPVVTPETVRSDVVPTAQRAMPDPARRAVAMPDRVAPAAQAAAAPPGAVPPETVRSHVVPTARQATPGPARRAVATPGGVRSGVATGGQADAERRAKVTSEMAADAAALADTHALAQVLYAALTAYWPGQQETALPAAPRRDGRPYRPRQVRAGVPARIDEITCRALFPPSPRDPPPITSPGEFAELLSGALRHEAAQPANAVVPLGATFIDSMDGANAAENTGGFEAAAIGHQAWRRPRRRVRALAAGGVLGALFFIDSALIGVSLIGATHAPNVVVPVAHTQRPAAHRSHWPSGRLLAPASAQAFDPYGDAEDENDDLAYAAIDGDPSTAWHTYWYTTNHFGNLKPGTGLVVDMGRSVTITNVGVLFGPTPGADVQLRIGDSTDSLSDMGLAATAGDVSGQVNLRPAAPYRGRYVLIWFTKLPPDSGGGGVFQADIYEVAVRGS